MYIHARKAGLLGATVLGGLHVLWSLLVLVGWAQPLINFSMWAHMAHFNVTVGPFDVSAAVTVILIAALIGYCLGFVIATAWNRIRA